MEPVTGSIVDETQYRQDVLGLPTAESEIAQAQQLINEAEQLGLKVPKVETAPGTASSTSRIADDFPSVLSSESFADRDSLCGSVTPSHEPVSSHPAPYPVISPLSDVFVASNHLSPNSARSLAPRSISTRPTSFCASEGRETIAGGEDDDELAETKSTRHSIKSVSSTDKKEKTRGGFMSAIGRIYFRKKRPPPIRVPPRTQATDPKSAKDLDHAHQQSTPTPQGGDHGNEQSHNQPETPMSKFDIPLYSKETVQRSMDDPELSKMNERHQMERSRHLAFQDAALGTLRRRHQTALSEKESDNRRKEEEKREKVSSTSTNLTYSFRC